MGPGSEHRAHAGLPEPQREWECRLAPCRVALIRTRLSHHAPWPRPSLSLPAAPSAKGGISPVSFQWL